MAAAGAPAAAQVSAPQGWRWITDVPAGWTANEPQSDSTWRFVAMPPGWHVTTGPGVILFDTTIVAGGLFSLEAEIFAFPDSRTSEYGLFVGGTAPGGTSDYTAFVLRRDGSAAVIGRRGDSVHILAPWIRHDSVHAITADGMAHNVLRIEAQAERLVFRVNGAVVAEVPRDGLATEGRFGFRVGEGINLHASRLDLVRHLAPQPAASDTPQPGG